MGVSPYRYYNPILRRIILEGKGGWCSLRPLSGYQKEYRRNLDERDRQVHLPSEPGLRAFWFDASRIETLNDPNVWFGFVLLGAGSRVCKSWVVGGTCFYAMHPETLFGSLIRGRAALLKGYIKGLQNPDGASKRLVCGETSWTLNFDLTLDKDQDEDLCDSFGFRWPGGRSWLR